MRWRWFFAFTTLFAASALFALVGGRIIGTVKDSTGASVGGAAVVAANATTGVEHETKVDDQGVYSFPALAVGQYYIETSAPGFTPYRKTGLAIDVNSALQVDVTRQLAGQSTTINANEEAAQVRVEKLDTQLGKRITSQRITKMPLNGHSYTDLLAVQLAILFIGIIVLYRKKSTEDS
jgi:hypothetical protein